jgi:two-component sensor histidine kinase
MSGDTLDRELRIVTFKGESRWLLGRSLAVGEPGKAPTRFIGANIDITDQKMSQERERLLAHELDHRAKNMLAMVQSVVQLTRADHMADFREAVIGRIQSLARSHSLLAASRWQGADMMDLIREELEPFMSGEHAEIKASGPRARLQPAAAQTLALLIHELATNAVKYGALSTEAGRLTVHWRLSRGLQGGDLCLTWTEMGGPPVNTPKERGFGSRLIVTSVERQLQGKVTMSWLTSGLHCEVTVPAEHLLPSTAEPENTESVAPEPSNVPIVRGDGRLILLVEDETLIAMQAERALAGAGYVVIGPIARLGDAPEAIANHALDGAILDINLNGERSFAIADLLVSRHVPFLFCTGFAATSILPDRFREIPVIVKPFSASTLLVRLQQTLKAGPTDLKRAAALALEAE